jgi:hypothetical protein
MTQQFKTPPSKFCPYFILNNKCSPEYNSPGSLETIEVRSYSGGKGGNPN